MEGDSQGGEGRGIQNSAVEQRKHLVLRPDCAGITLGGSDPMRETRPVAVRSS